MRRPPAWRLRARALAARLAPGVRAPDRGAGGHDPYFTAIGGALHRAGVARPTLVIDAERLSANIEAVGRALGGAGLKPRAVTKSLQAPQLLRRVMTLADTDRLMVFNGVMLEDIVAFAPQADVLLGRPLPAVEVEAFVRRHAGDGFAAARPRWLVDSARRLHQYMEIAGALGAPLRVCFEIDVGLHRGGLADPAALAAAVKLALAEPLIEITGLMGYDAHAAGMADPAGAARRGMDAYARFVAALDGVRGRDSSDLVLNAAGSLTWPLHLADTVANEAAIGSAFVLPTHYETPLARFLKPAVFIAQPVLKTTDPALIPGLEGLAASIEAADPNAARGFFLYGGYGDARVVSPPGLSFSRLYGGRSLLVGSRRVALEEDDFVFLRPAESEGELMRFGDIAVFDGAEISAWWPTFSIAA